MADPGLDAVDLTQTACWSCRAAIETRDNYCRRCGQGQGVNVSWYYRPWGIAASALLGLGPFALVLVWKAPLSKSWKLALATLIAGFTFFLGVGVVQLIRQVQQGLAAATSLLQGSGF